MNSDVLFRFDGNTEIPSHLHTSTEWMILLAGEFNIDYDGQDPVVMTRGACVYGPAELIYTDALWSCEQYKSRENVENTK